MDRIEEHNIESEDLEQFVINILKGIKAADVIEARYVLKLDLEMYIGLLICIVNGLKYIRRKNG